LKEYSLITSSDAHQLNDIAPKTIITAIKPTVSEISLALDGVDGRRVRIGDQYTNPHNNCIHCTGAAPAIERCEAGEHHVKECQSRITVKQL
jgi:hypothetical protein